MEVREDGVGSHSFEYDRIHLLPDYCSYDVDHWGFYADTGIATRLDDAYQYGQRACKLTDPSYHSRRSPQPQKATIGSLMKINYPTGGYTRFVYEPNSYCREVNADRDGLRVNQDEQFAGGIRVKEIYNNASADPACEFLFKRFVYRDVTDSAADTAHTSGILLQPPCYRYFKEFSGKNFKFRNDCYNAQSVRRLGSNPDACHIGYSCVSEIGSDNSVTVYRFVDFSDRSDDRILPTDLYFQYHVPYLSWPPGADISSPSGNTPTRICSCARLPMYTYISGTPYSPPKSARSYITTAGDTPTSLLAGSSPVPSSNTRSARPSTGRTAPQWSCSHSSPITVTCSP